MTDAAGVRPALTPGEVAQFERDGYLVVRVFEPADFEPVTASIDAWCNRRIDRLAARCIQIDPHRDAPFGRRGALLVAQQPDFLGAFDITSVLTPAMFDHLTDPRMLAVAAALLGSSDLALNPIHHVRMKPPRPFPGSDSGYFNVPWHQDSGVLTEDTDDTRILTCWRPLGEATAAMGCLQVLPGVHRRGHLPHVATDAGPAIDPAHLPDVEPVLLPCRAGEVLIMSQFTPHHSTPNTADVCRWSIDARYQLADAPSGRNWQPLMRLDGAARATADQWRTAWRECMDAGGQRVFHRTG